MGGDKPSRNPAVASDLDGVHQVVNMAPDVIDLISSSPPLNPPPSAQLPVESPRRNLPRTKTTAGSSLGQGGIVGNKPKKASDSRISASKAAKANDFVFLSDDFDTIVELDEEPIYVDATDNKRRRLSPPLRSDRLSRRISPGLTSTSTLPSVKISEPSRRSAFDDPIFTSSPDLSTTLRHKVPSRDIVDLPSARATDTQTFTSRQLEPCNDDSDPFASSPQPLPPPLPVRHLENTIAKSKYDESSDPFASSPLPITEPAAVNGSKTRPPHTGNSAAERINKTKPASPRKHGDWDPISSSAPEQRSFASSPPPPRQIHTSAKETVIDIEDSDSNAASDSPDELPDISAFDLSKHRPKPRSLKRSQSDVVTSNSRSTTTKRVTKTSVAEKAKDKEVKAAAKEAEKEAKRLEREQVKEAKAREKERAAALAEVNKVRTDKKVSTPEMIVDIPSSLNASTNTQLETLLKEVGVQHTKWDSPVDNVVKWQRKVKSLFNEDLGLWEPTYLRIEDEKHALVILTADEFVQLALDGELDSHVSKMELHFGNHNLIYLLEGLTPWMRKNRNLRNRQFASGVRGQEPPAAQGQGRRRNNAPPKEYIPEETIEDALVQLQVMHDVLIHHTAIPLETAQWITIFTQHISTIPYRKQRDRAMLGAGFCMDSGQVKTGDDAKDTYVRMLQEIVRVTAPIAYGIASEFGTVTELVNGLEAGGPTRLEAVKKCANKDGAFTDRTVGQAMSRRMHKVFTGRDEASTDV